MSSPKKIHIIFFETFAEAKQAIEKIKQGCVGCDQLNVVIREEGDMNHPVILGVDPKVKLYAGQAWNLIHERRLSEGWYNNN